MTDDQLALDAISAAIPRRGPGLEADGNGDQTVNLADLQLASHSRGRKVQG
jgi:hypothetical protein